MVSKPDRNKARLKRHKRIRGKISGTKECPRLSVYRSSNNIYAQLIDDEAGNTLAAASSNEKSFKKDGGNKEGAREVGKLLAERAKKANIEKVVFDRGGYVYQGRVEELAKGAREGGLVF